MKLNVGSGEERLEGYTSVDLYMPADIKDDITKLETIPDNSVEEVRIYHVLEHLKNDDFIPALKAIYRVLQPRGKLVLEVPNLLWLFQDFLDTPEDGRWGWKIQTIFGLQNHEGEYHRNGFSGERIAKALKETGFVRIAIDECFPEKYNQGVIDGTAYKP